MFTTRFAWGLLICGGLAACGATSDDGPGQGDGADAAAGPDARPPGGDADGPDPAPGDGAVLGLVELPTFITCGVRASARVTVYNQGTTAWTTASHRLGAVDDQDPLRSDSRVYLPAGLTVAPGEPHTFEFELTAPPTPGTYLTDWRMVHELVGWFGEVASATVTVACAANRPADPPPGQRLPLPNVLATIEQVAADHPDQFAAMQSPDEAVCMGDDRFLASVIDRLRLTDTRWGYNCKRGNCNDPSRDAIAYHWGPGPDEGSPDVYVVDIITGHCSAAAHPGWLDVTGVGGALAAWTGWGRF
ncbi:MAG: hypothetical protein KBG28_17520 [Kofleriaceae bacterium]|jgi:hypothetical protein|nr:hypothetical protein [Kofleriaceae bacterium]MBP6840227.1 hypothetical protein [Kofleriaceae bacterium]MBP9205777.1 hypothetical protein [Kofleriaceae bacterium]